MIYVSVHRYTFDPTMVRLCCLITNSESKPPQKIKPVASTSKWGDVVGGNGFWGESFVKLLPETHTSGQEWSLLLVPSGDKHTCRFPSLLFFGGFLAEELISPEERILGPLKEFLCFCAASHNLFLSFLSTGELLSMNFGSFSSNELMVRSDCTKFLTAFERQAWG